MYRLVYVSSATLDLSDADIHRILDVSQSNNYERFITGFLAYAGQSFMQALEGPEDEVRELYDRIKADPRHTSVTQIVGQNIQIRAFENWSMNYHRKDRDGGGMVVKIDEPIEDLMPENAPRDLLKLFSKFISTS